MTHSGLAELLSNTWGLLLVIFFFCGAIFFHELGHFLAAKWRGLKIDRFSVGFGPKILGWRGKDGVDYRLSLLPLGGYVALPQLADMRAIEGDSEVPKDKLPPISYADKMIVAAAGPAFNVILAFALATVVWWVGYPQGVQIQSTTIGYVAPTMQLDDDTTVVSPAKKAGLQPGDKILAIDGTKIHDWADVQKLVVTGSGRDDLGNPEVTLTIERNGNTQEVEVLPELLEINARSGKRLRALGIESAYPLILADISDYSPAQAAGLKVGDQVVSVDGKPVYAISGLNEIVQGKAGEKLSLGILRDGKPMTISVTPEAVPMTKPLLQVAYKQNEELGAFEFLPQYTDTTETSAKAVDRSAKLVVFEAPEKYKSLIGQTLQSINKQPASSLQSALDILKGKEQSDTVYQFSEGTKITLPAGFDTSILPPESRTLIGFTVDPGTIIAHPNPLRQIRDQIDMTLVFIGSLISPTSDVGINQMSGAVGIGRVLHTFSIEDIRLALWFSVLLNINLAILNLLPIPVLDGGHMAFATISKLMRRPLPVNFIAATQGTFMVLLLSLMLYVTFNDSMDWLGDHEADVRFERERAYYIPLKFEPK